MYIAGSGINTSSKTVNLFKWNHFQSYENGYYTTQVEYPFPS